MFSIIVAVGKNNEIGCDNKLMWHIPEDLKNFKEITTGKKIVMGRKTFESIGRKLPNRENIIISRNLDAEYAKEKGMAGVMFWEYSSDPKEYLLNTINETLK